MIYFVSGPVFVCAARAVNQQPPVIDGVTGAWGKGVSGPLSVWWSFPPPPPHLGFISSTHSVVFEQN